MFHVKHFLNERRKPCNGGRESAFDGVALSIDRGPWPRNRPGTGILPEFSFSPLLRPGRNLFATPLTPAFIPMHIKPKLAVRGQTLLLRRNPICPHMGESEPAALHRYFCHFSPVCCYSPRFLYVFCLARPFLAIPHAPLLVRALT